MITQRSASIGSNALLGALAGYHARRGEKELALTIEQTWRHNAERVEELWGVKAQRRQKDAMRVRSRSRQPEGSRAMQRVVDLAEGGGDNGSGPAPVLPVRDRREAAGDGQRARGRGDTGLRLSPAGRVPSGRGREAKAQDRRQPGLAAAKSDIQTPISRNRVTRSQITTILEIVGKELNIPHESIIPPPYGVSRAKRRDARSICHVLMRSVLGMTYQEIADAFYKHADTTASSVISRAMKRVKVNSEYNDIMIRCTMAAREKFPGIINVK